MKVAIKKPATTKPKRGRKPESLPFTGAYSIETTPTAGDGRIQVRPRQWQAPCFRGYLAASRGVGKAPFHPLKRRCHQPLRASRAGSLAEAASSTVSLC